VTRGESSPFLTAATAIGEALCRDAYWHDGRCNWVGRSASEGLDPNQPLVPTVAALGPDLYAGTAGVGLFLGQLYALTGNPTVRRTAGGAIRHALTASASLAVGALGLYGGTLGVAYAAVRAGLAADLPELASEGLGLARSLPLGGDHPAYPFDIISGRAGAILGLLFLSRCSGGGEFLDRAVQLGEELVAEARQSGRRWSWDSPQATGARMLTGVSHGAAGVAVSLLELFALTGSEPFFAAGIGAFDYEDYWFSVRRRNWPDLRSIDPSTTADDDVNRDALVYGTAWCHGSPGIGLARLRALSLVPASRRKVRQNLRASIDAAIESTLEQAVLYRRAEGMDVTPCHGLGGLTELLLAAASCRAGGGAAPASRIGDQGLVKMAERLWKRHIQTFGAAQTWPSGVPSGGRNPSLLLGDAGVGYSLLRLHDMERVPSCLMVETRAPN
jgi:lantibiotic modifying enzyme